MPAQLSQLERYLVGYNQRRGESLWGSEENAYDMAVHDPELYRRCYGEDADEFIVKYEQDEFQAARIRQRLQDRGVVMSARIVN